MNKMIDKENMQSQIEEWVDRDFFPVVQEVSYFKRLLFLLNEHGILSQSNICKKIGIEEKELQRLHEEYCMEHIIQTQRLGGEMHYRLTDFYIQLFENYKKEFYKEQEKEEKKIDISKYEKIYHDIRNMSSEEILNILNNNPSMEEKEFWQMIYVYFKKKKANKMLLADDNFDDENLAYVCSVMEKERKDI